MIDPAYCLTMARYNQWQNKGLRAIVDAMPEAELRAERGAFFGSIFGTLNHLLWADMMWMSRLSGTPKPEAGIKQGTDLMPTAAAWSAERFRMDGAIRAWAGGLSALDLTGELRWYSGSVGRDMAMPVGICVVHFFNHQTHHRGQIHAMLTAAGQKPGDTDLVLMPDDG